MHLWETSGTHRHIRTLLALLHVAAMYRCTISTFHLLPLSSLTQSQSLLFFLFFEKMGIGEEEKEEEAE